MTYTESYSPPVILIVEDEPIIRREAHEMVEGMGYAPVDAGDAAAALVILEQRPDVAVVFTDIGLPGDLNGIQLAKLVQTHWPNTRLLLTSGTYGGQVDESVAASVPFLGKPYTESKVRDAMRSLLNN